MATGPAALRLLVLLFVLFLVLLFLIFIQFGSADENQGTEQQGTAQGTNEDMMRIQQRTQTTDQTIRAEPGQTIILPCEAARNKDEIIIDWSKPDLGENDHVVLYRNDQFDDEGQNPSYKNRVDLQDRQMKNGDVSLVLKKVTTDDTGKYECRVHLGGSNRRKRSTLKNEPICIINLLVSAPGNKDEQREDGGNEGQKNDGGNNAGLIAGLPVFAVVVLLLAGGFLLYKKQVSFCSKSITVI